MQYLNYLKNEIKNAAMNDENEREVISIFFGGGTPSFMEPEYIAEIIGEVKNNFTVRKDAEITLETNPGTVDKNKLRRFNENGINRLSVGVQSFHKDELEFLTRIHDSQTAIDTIKAAEEAGFENVSLDLIFNLPGQSKERWESNLRTALSLPVKHISAYSLILEKGTILNKMVLDGKVKMQDIEHDADLYESTIKLCAENGFEQYEVSNFALKGYHSIHNSAYWRYKDYYGFGTSAHSFTGGKRWWNYSSLNLYIDSMKQKNSAVCGSEILTADEQHEEYIMLALRSQGIDRQEYINKFGESWLNQNKSYFEDLIAQNYLVIEDNFIKFTPSGYALCDEILQKLL